MMCDSAPNYLRFRIFLLFGSQHVKGRAISNPDYSTSFVCIWSPAPSHLSNMEDTTPDTQSPKRGSVDQKQHPQLGDGVVGGTATGPRVNGKNVYVSDVRSMGLHAVQRGVIMEEVGKLSTKMAVGL